MSASYNPNSLSDRRVLAEALLFKLTECGFTEDLNAVGETTYYREVPGTDRRVVVYTTIVGRSVRSVGTDAIRICGVHKNSQGKWLGLIKNKRVNRTGDVFGIADRMYARMRETYGRIMNPSKCGHCGSTNFLSKKGNAVCSEFCWEKK